MMLVQNGSNVCKGYCHDDLRNRTLGILDDLSRTDSIPSTIVHVIREAIGEGNTGAWIGNSLWATPCGCLVKAHRAAVGPVTCIACLAEDP